MVVSVAAAPFVGFSLESVSCGDGAFYGCGCVFRGVGDAVFEHGCFTVLEIVRNRLFGFYLIRAGIQHGEERHEDS